MRGGFRPNSGRKKGSIPWNKGVNMWKNKEHPRGMKGKKPWNFIDGTSNERRFMLREWVQRAYECYKRDNFTCQDCKKSKGIILNAHHIIPWSISKDDSLSNLITLCAKCHQKLHKHDRDKFGRFKK